MIYFKKRDLLSILSAIFVITLAGLACNMPGAASGGDSTPIPPAVNAATDTPTAPGLEINAVTATPKTADNNPQDTAAPATPQAQSTTAVQDIAHLTHPAMPDGLSSALGDSDSSITASLHRPKGDDYFARNMFERPFNANTQDTYSPELDILNTAFQNGAPWVYANITLKNVGASSGKLDASYAIEIDLDRQGRGYFLVVVNQPAEGDWSTNGVQVWQDYNHDVGGDAPVKAESLQKPGDGYEKLVFDQGKTNPGDKNPNDTDLAWARVDPNRPNIVWFAFKSSLIHNQKELMWGAWAQRGGLHPELFDYNDHMTEQQAGDPIPGMAYYPLKGLAEMDTTCRWAVGFNPTGDEPGLCPLQPTPTPGKPNVPGVPGAPTKSPPIIVY